MDKIALLLTCLVVVVASIIIMPNEVLMVAEAIYSIPPTPAWQTIGIDSNATYSDTGADNITALTSFDKFYIISDGSIGINITSYSP